MHYSDLLRRYIESSQMTENILSSGPDTAYQ